MIILNIDIQCSLCMKTIYKMKEKWGKQSNQTRNKTKQNKTYTKQNKKTNKQLLTLFGINMVNASHKLKWYVTMKKWAKQTKNLDISTYVVLEI